MTLVRDWVVLTALRIVNWLGWPTWLLVLIAVFVLPLVAIYSYIYWKALVLRASE